ncbi:transglutaminase-like domain-containing protein [Croceivirga radicis]|uniref:transglutaminase-like domain-containing protein n=1 Tax=Croceivirga radicis TaxID=1929488 RepID=UPI000255B070|nr:transglutaminase family protein [Croceivirga radicis]
MEQYLKETAYLNYSAKEIQDLIEPFKNKGLTPVEIAKQVYLLVRDGYRYDPYTISIDKNHYIVSNLAVKTKGHCIDKAIILIAALRGLGIPARLRLAKVTNHIAVERLTERFGTNVLTPHGMAEVYLNGKWVKATPAFNKELCILCKVAPLEFDGETDSMFQEYNQEGAAFMEYLEDYGTFDDVPLNFMLENIREHYPTVFAVDTDKTTFKF